MPVKDTKYEQHHQMIAASSGTDEQYVFKFTDHPIEYIGTPVLHVHPEQFKLQIIEPAEYRGTDPIFHVSDIEYMRKIADADPAS